MPGGKMKNDGFTLIEVMIGLTIFAIGLLALASMQMTGITGNSRAHVITAEVAAATGFISQVLSLSGVTADDNDDLYIDIDGDGNDNDDIDGDGEAGLVDFLETPIPMASPVSWTQADSVDGAGVLNFGIYVYVDPNLPNPANPTNGVTYDGLTLINVTVTNSAGKSVTQQIMKRRY